MSTVEVTGGVDGIAAHIDDLHALAAVLRTTSIALEDAVDDVTAPTLQWTLVAAEADYPTGIASVRRELGAQRAALQSVDELAASLMLLVLAAAAAYRDAEQSVGSSFLDSLADSVWGSTSLLPPALMASMTGVPEHDFSPMYALPRLLSPFILDGSPVLHDLGPDPTTSIPPRTLSDLVLDLSTRNQGRPGRDLGVVRDRCRRRAPRDRRHPRDEVVESRTRRRRDERRHRHPRHRRARHVLRTRGVRRRSPTPVCIPTSRSCWSATARAASSR